VVVLPYSSGTTGVPTRASALTLAWVCAGLFAWLPGLLLTTRTSPSYAAAPPDSPRTD
jgi:hypothetical protein